MEPSQSPELLSGDLTRLPLPLGRLENRHVKLEMRSSSEDHQSDKMGVDLGENIQVFSAQLLLPLQLSLVHVLDKAALSPAVHLHQLVLAGHLILE